MRLIEAYLLLGSYGDDEHPPLLRPKLHTFFHGVYDVGLCMNPACRTLTTDGADRCRSCGGAVRPAVLCRTCGQDFVKVRFDPDHPEQTVANDEFLSDEETAFLTPFLIGELTVAAGPVSILRRERCSRARCSISCAGSALCPSTSINRFLIRSKTVELVDGRTLQLVGRRA